MPSDKQITEDDLALIILGISRRILGELEHVGETFEQSISELVGHDVKVDREKLETHILRTKHKILESEICGRMLVEWIGHGEAVEQLRSASAVLEKDRGDEGEQAGDE